MIETIIILWLICVYLTVQLDSTEKRYFVSFQDYMWSAMGWPITLLVRLLKGGSWID